MQLSINNVDFTPQLKSESLRISREVKDYSANFTLILNSQQASEIQITQDVEIMGIFDKPLFGGLISNLSFEYIDEDNIFVEVQCTNYNIIPKRRTINAIINQEPTNPDPTLDMNRAGFWIRQYILPLLEEEGITEGWIEAGVQLAETEIEEFQTKSLKEILDVMAEASGFIWYIDHQKKLYFDSYISTATDHIEEDKIIKTNADFRNIRVTQDLSNYANKIFIIGGEYEGEEEIPEENLTEDDYIYFVKELPDEIVRMSAINGDSGVWGRVVEDANIKTLEDAEYLADNLLDQFGTPPIELEFETFKEVYVPGDYIYADFPFFGLDMDKFVVDNVEIEDNGTYLNYKVMASSRKNNNLPRESFFDYMAKLTRKAKEKGKTVVNNGNGSTGLIPTDNLEMWIDMQNSEIVKNGEKITEIKDVIKNTTALSQANIENQPTLSILNGNNYISFSPDLDNLGSGQIGEFLNMTNTITPASIFVVYRDKTPTKAVAGSYGVGYSCPIGGDFKGGGINDLILDYRNTLYNMWIDGTMVNPTAQTRVRDKISVLTLTVKDITNSLNIPLKNFGKNANPGTFNAFFKGDIAEIIVYSREMTVEEIEKINTYLKDKYLIQ